MAGTTAANAPYTSNAPIANTGIPLNPHPAAFNNRPLTEEQKRGYAFQYFGYPGFSEWMASSNDFFLLRRYSKLSARCLLHLQHEIAKREKELEDLDELTMKYSPGKGSCDSFEHEMFPRRNVIIKELTPLLQRYYDLVNSFAEIKSKPTTQKHHKRNLTNWFVSYPDAIDPPEQHFRDKEGDLFPIISRVKSPLRLVLEKWRWLRFKFTLEDRDDRIKSPLTTYTSGKGIERFATTVILTGGLCLLFGPMWWLNFVSDDVYRLAIITGFVASFTGLIWAAAGQRPFEILASTAAYAAVLMVFLQSSGGS